MWSCGVRVPIGSALARLPLPTCESCGANLKPDVVMFGEAMPVRETDRVRARARAALLLVVGSSLEVHPIAGLPEETLAAGGALAIVNRGETAYDAAAVLKIDASAGETLAAVVDAGALAGRAPQQALLEDAPARRTHAPLDLVGNARPCSTACGVTSRCLCRRVWGRVVVMILSA